MLNVEENDRVGGGGGQEEHGEQDGEPEHGGGQQAHEQQPGEGEQAGGEQGEEDQVPRVPEVLANLLSHLEQNYWNTKCKSKAKHDNLAQTKEACQS